MTPSNPALTSPSILHNIRPPSSPARLIRIPRTRHITLTTARRLTRHGIRTPTLATILRPADRVIRLPARRRTKLRRVARIIIRFVRELPRATGVLDVAAQPLVAGGEGRGGEHGRGLLRDGCWWGGPVFEDGGGAGEGEAEGGQGGGGVDGDLVGAWVEDFAALCVEAG